MIVRITPNTQAELLHVDSKTGVIYLKLNYFAQFAIACQVVSADGETIEEFDSNKAKFNKQIFVGGGGGLTFK